MTYVLRLPFCHFPDATPALSSHQPAAYFLYVQIFQAIDFTYVIQETDLYSFPLLVLSLIPSRPPNLSSEKPTCLLGFTQNSYSQWHPYLDS